ncbi:ISAs1 family transposase [Streptomyces sp. NBC_01754]|uniref:ISAs1 family transposase n=1 Tax=Streptomyces sp. NBC_01754 TaxID=2975930 RepID=UPI002DD834AE|nr:ISAs1 family transposase [Streptomyces sp. NBC_01754]WSC95815.1 ISAs1 family transposase [Streptomyces sp. NBC_01754]
MNTWRVRACSRIFAVPTVLDQLTRTTAPAPLPDAVRLSGFLDLVPDPRGVRRPPLSAARAGGRCRGECPGRRSLAHRDHGTDHGCPGWACRALGLPLDPLTDTVSVPHPHTSRRLLVQLDGTALDRSIGAFLTTRTTPAPAALRAIAVDGKALRGSRTATTTHLTLLASRFSLLASAAMDHAGHVLAHRQVADKSNETPAARPLPDVINLTGTVITADALRTQHTDGACLRDRGAHDIAQVKANHPGLFDRVRHLPRHEITHDHHDRTRAHHRLKTAAFTHLDAPRPSKLSTGDRTSPPASSPSNAST